MGEELFFCLTGGLERVEAATVGFWCSNATHHFVRLDDLAVPPGKGCFNFRARPDTIYTISTLLYPPPVPPNVTDVDEFNSTNLTMEQTSMGNNSSNGSTRITITVKRVQQSAQQAPPQIVASSPQGGSHQAPSPTVTLQMPDFYTNDTSDGYAIPDSAPFPKRHDDDFDAYHVNLSPRYFADYAGSWQVAEDPTRPSNKVLKQWVVHQAQRNQWSTDTEPITMIGDALTDVAASVDVYLPPYEVPHAGIEPSRINIQSVWGGLCLGVARQAAWEGAAAEALPCSPQWHEQLIFDESDGSIRLDRIHKCLSSSGCPGNVGDPNRAEMCFQDCCGGPGEQESCAAGQSWQWDADRGIRPSGQPRVCITVVEKSGGQPVGSDGGLVGAMLRLLPCPEMEPSKRQQWLPTATSFASYAGICVRMSMPPFGVPQRHKARNGYCLNLGVDEIGRSVWQLEKEGAVVLACGMPDYPTGYWHRLSLDARGSWITAMVDGWQPETVSDHSFNSGMVALNSGWGEALFDNFTISEADPDIMSI